MSWTERVRERLAPIVEERGKLLQMSSKLDIPYATLYDFTKKGGGLSSTNLEKLAESLGFRLVLRGRK